MPTCPLRPLRRAPSFRGISAAYRLRCGTDQCRTATAQGTREYSKTGAVQCTSQRACLPRACTSTLSPTNSFSVPPLTLLAPMFATRSHSHTSHSARIRMRFGMPNWCVHGRRCYWPINGSHCGAGAWTWTQPGLDRPAGGTAGRESREHLLDLAAAHKYLCDQRRFCLRLVQVPSADHRWGDGRSCANVGSHGKRTHPMLLHAQMRVEGGTKWGLRPTSAFARASSAFGNLFSSKYASPSLKCASPICRSHAAPQRKQ